MGPSRRWYVFAAVLGFGGIVGATLFVVLSIVNFGGAFVDQRVPVPGSGTLRLDGEKYVVYYQVPSGLSDGDPIVPGDLAIDVGRAGGEVVDLDDYSGSFTIDADGRSSAAIATFEAPAAGDYLISANAQAPSGATIAVGRPLARRILVIVAGALALALIPLVAAIVIAIMVATRRSRAKRTAVAAGPTGLGF